MTPNVLIILDNSANWKASFGSGTKFNSEIATLSSHIGGLGANVNVGLMMFGETGSRRTKENEHANQHCCTRSHGRES